MDKNNIFGESYHNSHLEHKIGSNMWHHRQEILRDYKTKSQTQKGQNSINNSGEKLASKEIVVNI